jgi:hypothetical protein
MAETHAHEGERGHEHMAVAEASAGGVAGRVGLTVLGAAGLIIGAFLDWLSGTVDFGGLSGTELGARIFISDADVDPSFLASAGAIVILLGLLALLGLAFRSGWLTRMAGALGVIAFVLFTISLFRAGGGLGGIGIGMWVVLVGGVVALVGGFVGTRRVIT